MDTLPTSQRITIQKLRADIGSDDLGADPSATIAAMDKRYSFSSTRVALAALKKIYPTCKEFAEESAKRRSDFKKLDAAQEPTDKQRDKFVSWPDVLKFRDEYRDQMTDVERLLLSLYTYIPPVRADYTPMLVVARKPRTLTDGTNYLVVGKSGIYAIFHAYKTHKVYGDIKTDKFPVGLEREVRRWLTAHPGKYLLQDSDDAPWAAQRIGATIKKLFQRFHSMDTGISTLRHSYSTHVYRGMPSLAQLHAVAKSLMHSPETSQKYRHLSLE